MGHNHAIVALKRLVALNAETELWWDRALEYAAWEQVQRVTWKNGPTCGGWTSWALAPAV